MSHADFTAEQIDSIQFDLAGQLRTARRRAGELMERVQKAKSITEVTPRTFLELADFTERIAALENLETRLEEAGDDEEKVQKALKAVRRNCQSELLYSDPASTNQQRMRAAQVLMGIYADAETL